MKIGKAKNCWILMIRVYQMRFDTTLGCSIILEKSLSWWAMVNMRFMRLTVNFWMYV